MKKTTALFFLTFILTNHAAQNALGALALASKTHVSTQPTRNDTTSLPSTPSYAADCAKDCKQDAGDCASVCWDLLCGCFTGEETDQAPSVPVVSDQDVFTALLRISNCYNNYPPILPQNAQSIVKFMQTNNWPIDPDSTPSLSALSAEERFCSVLMSGCVESQRDNPPPSYADIMWYLSCQFATKTPPSFTSNNPNTQKALGTLTAYALQVLQARCSGSQIPPFPLDPTSFTLQEWNSLLLTAQRSN